jgi:hypothetical protein
MSKAQIDALSAGNKDITQRLSSTRGCLSASLSGHFAWRKQIGIVIRVEFLVALSQGHLAQHHQACVVFP